MKNLNIRPYFDDYNEDKQFYQILFRPSYAIQARELNQMQTILQEQIARHGRNIFKEGSMVIPGQLSIDTSLDFVKLDSTYNGTSIDSYLSSFSDESVEVIGATSGIRAKVQIFRKSSDTTNPTIWVKYISSGDSVNKGTVKTFQPGEVIYTSDSVPLYATVKNASDAIGYGSSANIQKGVYFVNSRFVLVNAQTILLDDYTNSPSYRVGLEIQEDFITPEEDDSLYDNAQGSTNFSAPGAHRYYIDLNLKKYSLSDVSDKTFIELLRVTNGNLNSIVTTTNYSLIADAMARRTYDESGNYAIDTFNSQVKEHRNNNRGDWSANTSYLNGDIVNVGSISYVAENNGTSGLIAPTHIIGSSTNGSISFRQENSPVYNQGILSQENGGDPSKMGLLIDPGKAYVFGYEVSKAGQSTVTIDKASTYLPVRNATIQTDIGSYINIENVYGFLDVTQFPIVELRDRYTTTPGTSNGSIIGTARARYMEYQTGTIGSSSCEYVLSLFDIKMNTGKKFTSNVRQIAFTNVSGVNFTCDTHRDIAILSGSITTLTSSTTVTGTGTKFTKELNVGDAIGYYVSGTLYSMMIVQSISSDTLLTLTANAQHALTNSSLYSVSSTHYESSNDSLIFKLPTRYTRKMKDVDDETSSNIAYYVRQSYVSGTVTGGIATIASSLGETFASPQQPDAFHVVSPVTGAVIPATITLNGTANIATLNVGTSFNGGIVNVIATVKKTAKERLKSITRAFSEDITVQANAISPSITLSKVDGIRLLKVSEFVDSGGTPIAFGSSIPGNAVAVDITSRYKFDTGIKDSYYDFIKIVNNTSINPRSPIRITYDYHEHSSSGDYFTIDSYQKTISETYTKANGEVLDLFDCVDFRPSRNGSSFVINSIPAMGFDIISDYTYFQPRVDILSLNANGNFVITKGVPADSPVAPSIPENSMLMSTISVYPSIVGTPVISIKRENNKRYTMKDIGNLESRLSNVEYYTSLSLLESQTKNLQLFEANGDVSFKNGFIVDSLIDQSIAQTDSKEFKCSIDVANGILRPSFSNDNVKLFESVAYSDRKSMGYVVNNGIATLDYTTVSYIEQPYATRYESVTPYIKINFIGDISLTPSSDEWYETQYRPDIVINQEGNFSALANAYRSELGTVWNAWQIAWAGARFTTVRGRIVQIGGDESYTQTRTGTTTYIKAVYDTKVIDDRIVSIDIIPFIRPRTISFFGTGFKPNTKLFGFFDSTSIDSYINPSSIITLSSKNGTFDMFTDAGSDSNSVARSIASANDAVSTGLKKGDILHNGASGNIALATATAIVTIDEDSMIHVINQRGSFSVGQIVYGSISGANGIVSSISQPGLITNAYGEISGTFDIPSNSKIQFRTGTKNFILTDSSSNGTNYTTKALTTYTATGYMQNRVRTIVSTRNGVLAKEAVSESVFVEVQPVYADPLAQSFKIANPDGIFVDSFDLYFYSKDRILPVTFEIREMSNGIPTQTVLPGSRVTYRPNQINVSTNATNVTRIKTAYPVFLDGDTEYCFVLSSDSPYYAVWVCYVGENDVTTGQRISKQPYLGTLFKSQNASTWSPDQFEDIKFTLNRCVFNTASANIKFANQNLDTYAINPDAIYTKSGSNLIRLFVPNHGIPVGSNIIVSGLTSNVNGIPFASINGSHAVTYAEQDYVVISVGSNANITGYSKLTNVVYVTKHVKFELLNLLATQLKYDNTSIKHFARCTDATYSMTNNAVELIPQENTYLTASYQIASTSNESTFNANKKSIEVTAQLESSTNYLSPVLDLDRYSIVCIGNRIDTNQTTKNITGLDDVTSSIAVTFNSAGTITASVTGSFSQLKIGQIISISGATNSTNNGISTVTSIDSTGTTITTTDSVLVNETSTVSFIAYSRYFDEISENGTSEAKYIMNPLTLTNPASSLKVFFDVNFAAPSGFALYYRLASNTNYLSGQTWILASPVTSPKYSSSGDVYYGVEYDILSNVQFTSAQIKIVMTSSDTSNVPSIQQIRMIATS
jgi:hypothetical protein